MVKSFMLKSEVVNLVNNTETDELVLCNEISLIISSLLNNNLILIAYDCDSNFEPCYKNGRKAHWALINGFLLPISDESSLDSDLKRFDLEDNKKIISYRIDDDLKMKNKKLIEFFKLENFSACNVDLNLVRVFAYHGKSTYPGLWSLNDLLKSNKQLNEVDPNRNSSFGYVAPVDGLSKTLSSKILIVKS